MIDGVAYGLNKGMVGVGSDNSRGVFDNVAVQVLPPQLTLDHTEDFDDGVANLFTGDQTGTWAVSAGRYDGTRGRRRRTAWSVVDLGLADGLQPNSYLELEATLRTGAGRRAAVRPVRRERLQVRGPRRAGRQGAHRPRASRGAAGWWTRPCRQDARRGHATTC